MPTNYASKKYINKREIAAYSIGLFGLQIMIGMMNSYQAQFYNKTMQANFLIVGIIMLLARFLSALVDPIIGSIIDKSNFKNGKLRPFIMISIIPFVIISIVIFIVVPFRGIGLYIYIFITFFLWCVAMAFADIPSQSMLCALSPLPEERNKAAGISNIFKNIGVSASVVVMPIICILTKSEGGQIFAKEYIIAAIVLSLLGGIMFSMIFVFNKEKVPYQRSKSSLKEVIKMLKINTPMLLFILSLLLGFGRAAGVVIVAQAADALVGPIKIGSMVLSGENAIILLGFTSAISSLIGMILTPPLTKKLGEQKTFIISAIYGGVITTIAFILYYLGMTSLIFVLISLLFVGLMYGPHSFMMMVMVADCVDYYEYKTGIRAEGMHYSALSFTVKVTTALNLALGLGIVQLSGYSANLITITTTTKNIIYFAFVMVPGICTVLSMIPIFFYKLSGKEKKRISLELAEMRANKALAQEETQN